MHGLQLPSPTVHLPTPSVAAPRLACATTAMSSGTNIGWKRESLVLLSLAAPDQTLLLWAKTLPLPLPQPRTCRGVSATAHARRAARLRVVFTVMGSACSKLAAWWGKAWLCVIGRGPGNTSRHSATPSRGRVRWCWPSLVWWSASMKPWADGLLPDSDTDVVWAAPGGF